eukprot:gene630-54676_t
MSGKQTANTSDKRSYSLISEAQLGAIAGVLSSGAIPTRSQKYPSAQALINWANEEISTKGKGEVTAVVWMLAQMSRATLAFQLNSKAALLRVPTWYGKPRYAEKVHFCAYFTATYLDVFPMSEGLKGDMFIDIIEERIGPHCASQFGPHWFLCAAPQLLL